MNKIITIVVPTYNMEKYLDKCLTSLIVPEKDLMEQLEVLVVNDGSKDRSSEIAHSYQDRYPQTFRVIDKENGNYGSCVNRGLDEAKGKYIKILDADDWFDTTNLVLFVKELQKTDSDLVLSFARYVNESGIIGDYVGISPSFVYSLWGNNKYLLFNELLNEDYIFRLLMHSVAYKTENLKKIAYRQLEGVSYTDQIWIFAPMVTVNTVSVFPEVVYYYLVGREGQTVSAENLRAHFDHEMYVDLELCRHFERYRGDEQHKAYLQSRLKIQLCAVYAAGIFTNQYSHSGIRKLDRNIKISYRRLWDNMNSWQLHAYQPSRYISIGAWRKFGGLNFFVSECFVRFKWFVKHVLFSRFFSSFNVH